MAERGEVVGQEAFNPPVKRDPALRRAPPPEGPELRRVGHPGRAVVDRALALRVVRGAEVCQLPGQRGGEGVEQPREVRRVVLAPVGAAIEHGLARAPY